MRQATKQSNHQPAAPLAFRTEAATRSRQTGFVASLAAFLGFALLVVTFGVPATFADEGDGGEKKETARGASTATAAVRTAERNVTTPAGNFRLTFRQTPVDPRAGEEVQMEVAVAEQVEGGFGGGTPQPVAGTATARVTTATGEQVGKNIDLHSDAQPPQPGVFNLDYEFEDNGEYKTIFDVRTEDGRQFSTDFPVSVVSAPTNWLFWLGLTALALLSVGTIYGYFSSWQKDGATAGSAVRKTAPIAVAALVFFGVGTAALAYFSPPRERREIAALPPMTAAGAEGGATAAVADGIGGGGSGGLTTTLTIPKESQLLFGIRTATIEERQIVSGLRTTGTVRARPDARAIVSPPVSGRIRLNGNVQIGAAVGRGQQIGVIEQVLGAPEQASLEAQRIGLRTAALEQQARSTEQQSLATQARTRLTQAQRELQRARNLLEVGAAPRRRVEEAETAVQLAQQEVASAEQQARVAQQQVKLSNESVARVDPVRTFPLVAPVTGTISTVSAATGQQVEAGTELLNIVNLSTVLLEAQVFERDLAAVRDSGRATYTSPALGDEVYRIGEGGDGRLVSIGQSVDSQTRTVPVIFEVPNPSNRLREGVFVEITLDTSGGNSVLTVPKQAVVVEQGQTFVFVFDGGERFERRPVRLGAEGQDYFEVQQGLAAGDRVVTEGIYQLRSTQPT